MEKTAFKIRRKIITAFLFCVLSILLFAVFSFQIHREIRNRLSLLELTGDLFQNILEIRRFEKNFFLYKQPSSLQEAMSYIQKVEGLYRDHEAEILRLKKDHRGPEFQKTLWSYKEDLSKIGEKFQVAGSPMESSNVSLLEESLRNRGQGLVEIAEKWDREERQEIDHLFQRAMGLFFLSIMVFLALGILVAFYLARLFVKPLEQMQLAMDKIAHGDFTPMIETQSGSEEFRALFLAFNRMIRELEEHQEQLLQSRKIAAIGTLTSGIAHELNNPINNIAITDEALRDDFSELEKEKALALIHDIMIQSERASEIVKGLLDFSRSERPEFEEIRLVAVIEDTLKLVRNQLALSGIQVEKEVSPVLPLILGDRKSLQQVFLNLFINAIQAMPDGGNLTIGVHPAADNSRWLKIEVKDTGRGIEPENLPHIFDPFFTTKTVGRGTGLGLSVTYGIIEKHGGHIEVHSQPGKGTAFTVSLPTAEQE
jgi:two-component system, NtrC family, sensor kinase